VLHDAHVLATQPSPGAAFILRPHRGQRAATRRARAPQGRAAPGGRYGGSGRNSTFSRSAPPTRKAPRPVARPTRAHPWRQGFSRHSHELYRTWPGWHFHWTVNGDIFTGQRQKRAKGCCWSMKMSPR